MRNIRKLTTVNHINHQLMKGVNLMNAKRTVAALIVAGVIATIAVAQYGNSNGLNAKKKDLTGTWLLTIQPDEPGAPTFEGLYTFTSDGIALFSSVGPPIPGLGNPGHGIWVRTGPNTFAVTWKQFTFDDIYTCNGSLVFNSTITITGADEFVSKDNGKIFDLDGHEIVTLVGSVQGSRMRIDQ